MGLKPFELFELTPYELEKYVRGHRERNEAVNTDNLWLAGAIIASIFNSQRTKRTQKYYKPDDIFPTLRKQPSEKDIKKKIYNIFGIKKKE